MFGTKSDSTQQNLKKCLDLTSCVKMRGLLQNLVRREVILSESVCKAMAQVDRGEFTDSEHAYSDSYICIV